LILVALVIIALIALFGVPLIVAMAIGTLVIVKALVLGVIHMIFGK
jgi:hypothetical protein